MQNKGTSACTLMLVLVYDFEYRYCYSCKISVLTYRVLNPVVVHWYNCTAVYNQLYILNFEPQ
jgi:hypothetical protein